MSDSTNGDTAPAANAALVEAGKLSPLVGALARAGNAPVCSFPLNTAAGRELLQKCEEEPDKPVRELANMELKLANIYARVVDYTNPETQEVYPIMRICLITTGGDVHPCASDGIRDSLLRLVLGHGEPPWKDGIPVRIALKVTKDKKQRLSLLEVFPKAKGAR